ncbi:FkbM family methyltransferase [Hymenobacter persicinus]|uniref:FkbM family methyltransferase n=1 Tax=Hymenobacter persicinus TaxID=2025506 RepID=A0A4Q5LA08_9BACT|nr:FkbM family methyltransferase [Hymenobacter persicinus]RYU77751.1 FkbM family methyltransferase [Hymenobacter persicinus]
MKEMILRLAMLSMKSIPLDSYRYLLLKPLFKLNHEVLNGFHSFNNDRFFIYQVDNHFLPTQSLAWPITYKNFEKWCDTTALNKYKVSPGDVIVDIGAGMGEEIIVLSHRVGPTGKVYAVEANPQVCSILERVAKLNKLDNTVIANLAINSSNEDITLTDDADSYLAGTLFNKTASATAKVYKVRGVTMDTFFEENNITHIDLLKSNIEGAERFVVDSISKKYVNRIKCVAISCHDFRYAVDGNEFFKTKEYVSKFLTDNGFEISSQQSGVGHIDDYVYGVNKNYGLN